MKIGQVGVVIGLTGILTCPVTIVSGDVTDQGRLHHDAASVNGWPVPGPHPDLQTDGPKESNILLSTNRKGGAMREQKTMKTILGLGIAAMAFCLSGPTVTWADEASPSVKSGMPVPDNVPSDKRTDLTGGEKGIPEEYSTTPVRQGSLKEVNDSKWLNQSVTNNQGEKLGTIKKVLKDEKTQNIEYVFFEIANSRDARPMKWSSFEQKGDKLVLNMTKEQLLPPVNRTEVKDMSPDLAMFMDEIEQKRAEPKPFVGPGDGRGTNRAAPSSGSMGEDSAAGNLGPRGAPGTPAPGFKNEAQKGKTQ